MDTEEIFNDEAWMDDDYGLSDESPKKTNNKMSPKSPKVVDLKFTTDVFSAVPSTAKQVRQIVDCCVEKIYEQRRFGEPMIDAKKPKDLYVVGQSSSADVDLSLNRDSDAAYRDLLFDYCKEIVADIYDNESSSTTAENAVWKKPERLKLSKYSKITPKNVDSLKLTVENVVGERLNLSILENNNRKTGRENIVARKKLDKIDEILLPEMYAEEPDWTNYDDEELKVKLELADSIWKIVLDDCLSSQISIVLSRTVLSRY